MSIVTEALSLSTYCSRTQRTLKGEGQHYSNLTIRISTYNREIAFRIMDLSHAGKKITKGSRYVLVVFMEIEDFEIHHSWKCHAVQALIAVPYANEVESKPSKSHFF